MCPPFLYRAQPLFGFLLTYVSNMSIHGWGAIKNPNVPPFPSGAQPLFSLLSTMLATCSPTAGEPLKTLTPLPLGDTPAFLGLLFRLCGKPYSRHACLLSHGPWVVISFFLGTFIVQPPEAYEGSAIRGGAGY